MYKKLFLLFIALLLIAFMGVGCKGKRSVRVVIEHPYWWEAYMIKGDTLTPHFSDNETRTYDLGDYKSKITVEAWQIDTNPNTKQARLYIKIIEDYAPGFLYLESSEIKNEISTEEYNFHIQAMYDFGSKDNE
ncbi:MAG: hypothetical protein JXR81_05055 [Candidatus Goldbacteria bacterium]|nr:hypothetical protein [Candidatus Goldiibacteriota bacterium]